MCLRGFKTFFTLLLRPPEASSQVEGRTAFTRLFSASNFQHNARCGEERHGPRSQIALERLHASSLCRCRAIFIIAQRLNVGSEAKELQDGKTVRTGELDGTHGGCRQITRASGMPSPRRPSSSRCVNRHAPHTSRCKGLGHFRLDTWTFMSQRSRAVGLRSNYSSFAPPKASGVLLALASGCDDRIRHASALQHVRATLRPHR